MEISCAALLGDKNSLFEIERCCLALVVHPIEQGLVQSGIYQHRRPDPNASR